MAIKIYSSSQRWLTHVYLYRACHPLPLFMILDKCLCSFSQKMIPSKQPFSIFINRSVVLQNKNFIYTVLKSSNLEFQPENLLGAIKTSPTKRSTTRRVVSDKINTKILVSNMKFAGEVKWEKINVRGVRLQSLVALKTNVNGLSKDIQQLMLEAHGLLWSEWKILVICHYILGLAKKQKTSAKSNSESL